MISYKNPLAEQQYRELLNNLSSFPLCFTYAGKEYSGFSPEFAALLSHEVTKSDGKETTCQTFSFGNTLTITLISSFYESHGAFEWTAYFENTSDKDSEVLENVHISYHFDGENPVLKGIYGDHDKYYEPYCYELAEAPIHFENNSGRATHVTFPYFNLEYGTGGAMLAIGWAGTWTADFIQTEHGVLYTAKSVNNLKTFLKPGEKIRTALFVIAPYTVRDEYFATNYWRDWYTKHNLPKADAYGTPLTPFSTCCLASDTGILNSDGSISERYFTWKPSLEKMFEENVKVDFRWFDAGWYQTPYLGSAESFVKGKDWWSTVGTWVLDPEKWPGETFLESTEFARQHGMKTLMWFEPERVTYPDDLAKNFGYNRTWAIEQDGVKAISNNIGDDACRRWTTDRICKTLRDNKVEMYREDNNCNSAGLWAFLDQKEGGNRFGITESKFINGHYLMWDEIIACTTSYGGCAFVDSCASGGGRNDLESMRRGVPLLRSDSDRTSTALRLSMTTAFNKWIPFCGANTKEKLEQLSLTGVSDKYVWRASYLAILNVDSQFVQDPDQDFDTLRFGLGEWKKVAPYILKEFYVLTPWHTRNDASSFTAYAFFDEETQTGCLFAFSQEDCTEKTLSLRLPFLSAGQECNLTDEDTEETITIKADDTFEIAFPEPRTAKLFWIEIQ